MLLLWISSTYCTTNFYPYSLHITSLIWYAILIKRDTSQLPELDRKPLVIAKCFAAQRMSYQPDLKW